MAHIAQNTLQIDKLRLTGNMISKQQYLSQLQKIDWPAAKNQRWYFIRQMHIKSNTTEMAATMVQQTRQILNTAINADSNATAQHNDCIYFANKLQLLISLSIDIYYKQADKNWYWQQWRYLLRGSSAEQLTALWLENIAYLPALLYGLSVKKKLYPIWSSLDNEQYHSLLNYYCQHLGISKQLINESLLQQENSLSTNNNLANNGQKKSNHEPGKIHKNIRQQDTINTTTNIIESGSKNIPYSQTLNNLNLPDAIIKPWLKIFSDYFKLNSINSPGNDPVSLNLAALLILTQWKPSLSSLYSHDISKHIKAIINCFSDNSDNSRKAVPDTQYIYSTLDEATLRDHNTITQTKAQQNSFPEQQVINENNDEKNDEKVTFENNSIAKNVMSHCGGLFYLINIINHPESMKIISQSHIFHDEFSGWRLLFQFGLHLFPGQLTLKNYDPELINFFTQLCHIKDSRQLLSPDYSKICQQIQSLMTQHKTISNLLNKKLLLKKSFIVCSPSHLDIYFSEQDIDLSIRRSGLDINPGWVSCLGRVVTFHYQKDDDFIYPSSNSQGES